MTEVKENDIVFVADLQRRRIVECGVKWVGNWHAGVYPIQKPAPTRTIPINHIISAKLASLLIDEKQCVLVEGFA